MAENTENTESKQPRPPIKRTLHEEAQRHKKRTQSEMRAQVTSKDRLKYHVPKDPTKESKKVEQNLGKLEEPPEEKRKNIERIIGIGHGQELDEERQARMNRLEEEIKKIKKQESQEK